MGAILLRHINEALGYDRNTNAMVYIERGSRAILLKCKTHRLMRT